MEFLKQVKKPSTKKKDVLNVTIEVKRNFTENNNEKLLHFLTLLQKNINLTNFKYLSYAKKTEQSVILTQMDDAEIRTIKKKQKMIHTCRRTKEAAACATAKLLILSPGSARAAAAPRVLHSYFHLR